MRSCPVSEGTVSRADLPAILNRISHPVGHLLMSASDNLAYSRSDTLHPIFTFHMIYCN